MDLPRVERELKKRWNYPYRWGRRQSDDWDRRTNFIYTTYSVASLLKKTEGFEPALRDYAMNRWYNFWSAKAVEEIFAEDPRVEANRNVYDKRVDFRIDGIPFDHKTSVFPRGFERSYAYARQHKRALIEWLYAHQSQEGRKHLRNRLFVLLYDGIDGEHWKMKAEIFRLKELVHGYLRGFSRKRLERFDFGEGTVYADILWMERGVEGTR